MSWCLTLLRESADVSGRSAFKSSPPKWINSQQVFGEGSAPRGIRRSVQLRTALGSSAVADDNVLNGSAPADPLFVNSQAVRLLLSENCRLTSDARPTELGRAPSSGSARATVQTGIQISVSELAYLARKGGVAHWVKHGKCLCACWWRDLFAGEDPEAASSGSRRAARAGAPSRVETAAGASAVEHGLLP
jgi:hypothetical protein